MVNNNENNIQPLPLVDLVWSREELKHLQENDPEIQQIKNNIKGEKDEIFYINDEGLVYKLREGDERQDKIYAPQIIRKQILKLYHDSCMAAHAGQKKTIESIKRNFYWKNLIRDVKEYCNKCHSCNLRKTLYTAR